MPIRIKVIADSGQTRAPEPRAVIVGGERYDVLGMDDRWHDADAKYFKVAVADGRIYLLRYALEDQSWSVVKVWDLDA